MSVNQQIIVAFNNLSSTGEDLPSPMVVRFKAPIDLLKPRPRDKEISLQVKNNGLGRAVMASFAYQKKRTIIE
jgi:hypothetical protein